MKKPTIAGMFLWEVEIEYDGWVRIEDKTITVATRGKTLLQAQRKTESYLKAFRYDYPKAKITGIRYRGMIHA